MYYVLCGIAGAICCGATHTGITPLDLVKCRMQVDPAKYPSLMKGVQVSLVFSFPVARARVLAAMSLYLNAFLH